MSKEKAFALTVFAALAALNLYLPRAHAADDPPPSLDSLDSGSQAPNGLPELPPLPDKEPDSADAQPVPESLDKELDVPLPSRKSEEVKAAAEPPPAPAAEPDEVSAPVQHRGSSHARNDRIPIYQRIKPNWGVSVNGANHALGDGSTFGGEIRDQIRAISFEVEYQPTSFQSFGVLSFGGSYNFYIEEPNQGLSDLIFGMYSFGAQARYQFRFMREQPLVPYLALGAEYFKYDFNNAGAGALGLISGRVGLALLLNVFEPSGAAAMYAEQGISRSYLIAELRNYSGGDTNVSFSGKAIHMGLRFEF